MKNVNTNRNMEEYIIEQKRKYAYELYFDSSNTEKAITIGCKYLSISRKQFLQYIREYIDKHCELPLYAIVFQKLMTFETSEEVIQYLININLPINYLETKLLAYIMNYRPDILLSRNNIFNDLTKKITLYGKYLENLKKQTKTIKKTNFDRELEIINGFINSKYSLERFCFNNRITITTFNSFLSSIKTINYDLYEVCTEKKDKSMNEEIENEVYLLLNLIKELGYNFDTIDFFMNTICGIKELIKQADKQLSFEDAKLFRTFINTYQSIKVYPQKTIDNLLNIKNTINLNGNLVEMTTEDKLIYYKFLKRK